MTVLVAAGERISRLLTVVLSVLALQVAAASAVAKVEKATMRLADGAEVNYRIVLPDDYDPEREYPALLVFGGGGQSARETDWALQNVWRKPAEDRGYLVFSPIADSPEMMFLRRGATIFPEFLDRILADYKIKGGKFHIAGISNGGISAYLIAAMNPRYFTSILTMPGYVGGGSDTEYAALRNMCIVMVAGERDRDWVPLIRRDADRLRAMGRAPYLEIVPRQGHIPRRYTRKNATKLFDLIEKRAGC